MTLVRSGPSSAFTSAETAAGEWAARVPSVRTATVRTCGSKASVKAALANMRPAVLEAGETIVRERNGERRDFYWSAEDDTFSWFIPDAKGRHDLKFGARFTRTDLDNPNWSNMNGTYRFDSDLAFDDRFVVLANDENVGFYRNFERAMAHVPAAGSSARPSSSHVEPPELGKTPIAPLCRTQAVSSGISPA